jgi:hypothetical protein
MKLLGWILTALGIISLVLSLIWNSEVLPLFFRFPTQFSYSVNFSATVIQGTDPTNGYPLSEKLKSSIPVSLTVKELSKSSSDTFLVDSVSLGNAAGNSTLNLNSEYVFNSRSFENIASRNSWDFKRNNVVDKKNTYWIQLPINADNRSQYNIWSPYIKGPITVKKSGNPFSFDGISVIRYTGDAPQATNISAFLGALGPIAVFPSSLSSSYIKRAFLAANLSDQYIPYDIQSYLTSGQLTALKSDLSSPIPVSYSATEHLTLYSQPNTGSIIARNDNISVTETLDLTAINNAVSILSPLEKKSYYGAQWLKVLNSLQAIKSDTALEINYNMSSVAGNLEPIVKICVPEVARLRLLSYYVQRSIFYVSLGWILLGILSLLLQRLLFKRP